MVARPREEADLDAVESLGDERVAKGVDAALIHEARQRRVHAVCKREAVATAATTDEQLKRHTPIPQRRARLRQLHDHIPHRRGPKAIVSRRAVVTATVLHPPGGRDARRVGADAVSKPHTELVIPCHPKLHTRRFVGQLENAAVNARVAAQQQHRVGVLRKVGLESHPRDGGRERGEWRRRAQHAREANVRRVGDGVVAELAGGRRVILEAVARERDRGATLQRRGERAHVRDGVSVKVGQVDAVRRVLLRIEAHLNSGGLQVGGGRRVAQKRAARLVVARVHQAQPTEVAQAVAARFEAEARDGDGDPSAAHSGGGVDGRDPRLGCVRPRASVGAVLLAIEAELERCRVGGVAVAVVCG